MRFIVRTQAKVQVMTADHLQRTQSPYQVDLDDSINDTPRSFKESELPSSIHQNSLMTIERIDTKDIRPRVSSPSLISEIFEEPDSVKSIV